MSPQCIAMTISIRQIYRYPVKGLTPEPRSEVHLTPGNAIPNDRRFALAPGSTSLGDSLGEWMAKSSFLMLMRNERLAQLETTFDDGGETLIVKRGGRQVAKGVLSQPIGRTMIEDFFTAFLGDEAKGRVKLIEAADGHVMSDHPNPVISLINLASVTDMERVVGKPVDPRRFRGNFLIDGLDAWAEFDLCGKRLGIGDVVLEVTERIDRCGATNVNPETAERDMNIPKDLQRGFGHIDCGVFAKVINGGTIRAGDLITVL
tara:strand:+ start:4645 stop:5427 length:783 start_codon:yes stop_codon:yes gene_type:complete